MVSQIVQKSRHGYQHHHHHHLHPSLHPQQNGYHSPPNSNNSGSPTHTEDIHHSPIYRHDSEPPVQQQIIDTTEKGELSPSSTEDNHRIQSSSPPSLSTGRRKGKPKKLVNHVDRSPSPTIFNNNNNNIPSPYLTPTSDDMLLTAKETSILEEEKSKNRYTPPRCDKDSLTVEIPETTAAESPRSESNSTGGNLEEYPVMIIRENGEEPIMNLKVFICFFFDACFNWD